MTLRARLTRLLKLATDIIATDPGALRQDSARRLRRDQAGIVHLPADARPDEVRLWIDRTLIDCSYEPRPAAPKRPPE